jgi:hypothetical protein
VTAQEDVPFGFVMQQAPVDGGGAQVVFVHCVPSPR